MSNYAYQQDDEEPETVAEPEDTYWQDMHEFITGQQGDEN